MGEPHVVSGLRAKQEEIRRRIRILQKQLTACRADLATMDRALYVFGEPAKYPKRPQLFGRGERARIIFDALREAPDGLDTKELAIIVMKAKGLELDKAGLFQLRRHICIGLQRFLSKGRVKQGAMRNGVRVWRLT